MILRPLSDESSIIAEAIAKLPEDKYNTGSTSLDWFTRRIKNQRIKNRTVGSRSCSEADCASSFCRARRHGGPAVALNIVLQRLEMLPNHDTINRLAGIVRKGKNRICMSMPTATSLQFRLKYIASYPSDSLSLPSDSPILAVILFRLRSFCRINRTRFAEGSALCKAAHSGPRNTP